MGKAYIHNKKLKYARDLRGWSQEELARRVGCLAESMGHQGVILDVSTISRWERGRNAPGPFYRQLLCLLFETNAEELGLLPLESPSQPVENAPALPDCPTSETIPVEQATSVDQNASDVTVQDYTQWSFEAVETPLIQRPAPRPIFIRRRNLIIALATSATIGGSAAIVARLLRSHPVPAPPVPGAPTATASSQASIALNVSSDHPGTVSPSRSWPTVKPDIHKEQERVRIIQWMLNAHGWRVTVDGIFWVTTENALMFFQESARLPLTNMVSAPTWERLILSSKMASPQIISQGSQVKALQEILNMYKASSPRLQVDGEFGPLTEAATRHFQQTHRIAGTGQADLNTWCVLVGGSLK